MKEKWRTDRRQYCKGKGTQMTQTQKHTSLMLNEMENKTALRQYFPSDWEKSQNITAVEDEEKQQVSYAAGGNINWYNLCGGLQMQSLFSKCALQMTGVQDYSLQSTGYYLTKDYKLNQQRTVK